MKFLSALALVSERFDDTVSGFLHLLNLIEKEGRK